MSAILAMSVVITDYKDVIFRNIPNHYLWTIRSYSI
jgi:hypothetical protein